MFFGVCSGFCVRNDVPFFYSRVTPNVFKIYYNFLIEETAQRVAFQRIAITSAVEIRKKCPD